MTGDESESRPRFVAPKGACDTHFHVFGPPERYPGASSARYAPPFAPLPDYLDHARAMGVERMVVVQPSAYGRDNACTLDTLAELGSRARAIVDIDEDCPEDLIEDYHAQGVRGVRINVSPVAPFDAGLADRLMPRIDRLEKRLAARGWLLEFLGPGWLTEALMPRMHRLEIGFIVDHLGMFPAREGPGQSGFQKLLALYAENTACLIKLTGIYRFATAPDFADAGPMIAALAEVAPGRLIWGSDYPHLSFADKVDTHLIFDRFEEWLPTEQLRQAVFVDNPARIFGF